MTNVTKTYFCPMHPDIEVGQVREYVVYDGVTDNGEDYSTEQDSDFWSCWKCDCDIAEQAGVQ